MWQQEKGRRYLEAKTELFASKDGRAPLELLGLYAPAILGFTLLILFKHSVVETDDVLSFVVLEK